MVYVELFEVGCEVKVGEVVVVVELVKIVSDIYVLVSGMIIVVNDELSGSFEKVNESFYEGGWLFKFDVIEEGDLLDVVVYEV